MMSISLLLPVESSVISLAQIVHWFKNGGLFFLDFFPVFFWVFFPVFWWKEGARKEGRKEERKK